jgi:hypothetical protein
MYHTHSFKLHHHKVILKFLPNVKYEVCYITNQKVGEKKKDITKDGRTNSKHNYKQHNRLIRTIHYDNDSDITNNSNKGQQAKYIYMYHIHIYITYTDTCITYTYPLAYENSTINMT